MERTLSVFDLMIAVAIVAALGVGGVWLWGQRTRRPPPPSAGGPDGPAG